jgi:Flp pilus assembly protein TadD
MKRVFVLAVSAGMLLLSCVVAEAQDDQYVQLYNLIQEADTLNHSNQAGPALAKYLDAQTTLQKFRKLYPDWNSTVVNYRLNYLASKIAELSARTPPPAPPAAAARPATGGPARPLLPPAEKNAIESQLRALQNLVEQLQADKLVLEARLKEAFAAQPAAADPRELAKAEEKIRAIEKENALLKVTLKQQQTRPTAAGDTNTLERLKRDLAEASRKLAEQAENANALALEKKALQNKLDSLVPAAWKAASLDATRTALEQANRELARQTELATSLALEKDTLQARVKTLEADAEVMAALHSENELLKKQLAGLKPPAAANAAGDANRQLAEARAQIAALQSDKEILQLEKIALQNRVKQVSAPAVATTLVPAPGSPAEAARVKQLERERADLQKKLEATQKELYGRKSKSAAARIEDLTGQLAVLRARLGVFEAQQVPYTEEELALFRKPEPALAAAPRAGRKPVRELPAGTATLVAEARRDFAARDFEKAEQKYLQVLRQDEKNVNTLANLATIQLELNRLDEAQKHLQEALAVAPDDAYSLSILGNLQFRERKFEQALDTLSRAAKLDPQNAQIQNFLGLTLSQQGARGPAETALRKAIQLDPQYWEAHYNLAVVYLTQRPPLIELARWHYKQALAAGFPPNAGLEKMLEQAKAAEPPP